MHFLDILQEVDDDDEDISSDEDVPELDDAGWWLARMHFLTRRPRWRAV